MDVWIPAIAAVVAAIVGGLLTHLYRDYRDRPIVKLSIDEVRRSYRSLKLPDELWDKVSVLGTFHQWLDKIVFFNAEQAFIDNQFTKKQLRDIHHLIPKFSEKNDQFIAQKSREIASVGNPTKPPSNETRLTLSKIRNYWLKQFNEDIFIAYEENHEAIASVLKQNLEGDKHQAEFTSQGVEELREYLNIGFSPDATVAKRIESIPEVPNNPNTPFFILKLIAQNIGKSQILINGEAVLSINGNDYILTGLVEEAGLDIYSGSYYELKPFEIELMTFTQHPQKTNQEQLNELANHLNNGAIGVLTLTDHIDNKHTLKNIELRESINRY